MKTHNEKEKGDMQVVYNVLGRWVRNEYGNKDSTQGIDVLLKTTKNSNHLFLIFTPFDKTIKCYLYFIGYVLCVRHCDKNCTYILMPARNLPCGN